MDFEFDPAKSAANKAKHGIDFKEAQELWQDGKLLIGPTRSETVARFIAVGLIGEKFWSAVCTMRGEALRLISVRRSRAEEIERYEAARQDH